MGTNGMILQVYLFPWNSHSIWSPLNAAENHGWHGLPPGNTESERRLERTVGFVGRLRFQTVGFRKGQKWPRFLRGEVEWPNEINEIFTWKCWNSTIFSGGSFKDYVSFCFFFPNVLLENDVLSAGFELQLSTNDLNTHLSRTEKLASFWGPYPYVFFAGWKNPSI